MAIDIALLGCAHPDLADVLGVVASEPDVRLAAVWDEDRSLIPAPVRDYAVADAETAIGRADAVVISATIGERPVLCVRAARAGRPALVQMPLALTQVESRRLASELARHRTPVLPALPLRELPALARLRGSLRAGVLGRVSGVEAMLRRSRPIGHRGAGPQRRRTPAVSHGFVELAVHLLDALALLGEPPRLDAVSLDTRSGGADLGGAGLGRWGSAPLVVRASLASAEPGLRLVVDGARAGAELVDGALVLREGAGSVQRWVGGPPDPGEPVRAFLARLRRRDFPRDPLAGVVRAQAVAERAESLA